MSQMTFASLTPKKKSTLRVEQFLEEMEQALPWKRILKFIKPHYYNNTKGRGYATILL